MAANDPQLQKEMEQMQLPKMDVPDMGEMMANFFGGGAPKTKKKAVTASTTKRK